jgi:hypothetical protein
MCAIKTIPPRIASLQDFYPGKFPKKIEPENDMRLTPRSAGLKMNQGSKQIFGGNLQTSQQLEMLAHAGFAVDKRKKK